MVKPIVVKLLPCDVVSHQRMLGCWVVPSTSVRVLHPSVSLGQVLTEGLAVDGAHRGTVGWYDLDGQPVASSWPVLCGLQVLPDAPDLPEPVRKVVHRVG